MDTSADNWFIQTLFTPSFETQPQSAVAEMGGEREEGEMEEGEMEEGEEAVERTEEAAKGNDQEGLNGEEPAGDTWTQADAFGPGPLRPGCRLLRERLQEALPLQVESPSPLS